MRFAVLTTGTQGDIQPFVALAQGILRAGHEAVVAAPARFERFVRNHGVAFAPLGSDYSALLDSPEGKAAMGGNPIKAMRMMKTTIYPMMRQMLDDSVVAVQGADAIIYHPKALAGVHLAEWLRVPCFLGAAVPIIVPTRAFPAPAFVARNLGGFFNRMTYAAINLGTRLFRAVVDQWRKERLGLPPRNEPGHMHNGRPIPVLHAFSPQVVPAPADWPDYAKVTGYWFVQGTEKWEPPARLASFLAEGPEPVYVGFGSVSGVNRESVIRTAVESLQKAGVRGILATGTEEGMVSGLPDSILAIPGAPHDWLFPRMAAVVHHGGAGTVATGLAAGKPTLVCPFTTDQPFWGRVVHELGVGPAPIPGKQLTVERLTAAIREVATDDAMRRRAADLGARIRAEDGVSRAVEQILSQMGISVSA